LTLDLEDVQGQQDDLTDTDQTTGSRRQQSLASLLAKRRLEVGAVVLCEVIAGYRLATVLVYPLQYLVAGGISQTGEKRDKLLAKACIGLVLEDDSIEFVDRVDLPRDP
jgi:hypothetical protein